MKNKLYFISVLAYLLVLFPIISTAIFLGVYFIGAFAVNLNSIEMSFILTVVLSAAAIYFIWRGVVKRKTLPESVTVRYLPFAVVFLYFIILWIIGLFVTNYALTNTFINIAAWLSLPYLVFNIFFSMMDYRYILIFPCIMNIISVVLFSVACIDKNKKLSNFKGAVILPSVVLSLIAVLSIQFYYRSTFYISPPGGYSPPVAEDIELRYYLPYTDGSRLEVLGGAPNLVISGNYPTLDGATAAYPVYAAMAQALYEGLGVNSIHDFVLCSKTDGAYENLINGGADIIFAAQPSKQQIKAARELGVELKLTPVAKEAFVFTVNAENPVENLTVKQIQDIYTRKITNWKTLGGNDGKITAFQRPENSGSQTVMLAAVMKGKKLPEPLREESYGSMGGLVTAVADYANYPSSIGYSFRFFAAEMNKGLNIKLLSVEGISPSPENISSGAYPFTVEVYAVTAGSKNPNIESLLEWILSEQGQDFIEQCGYVRINPSRN